MRSKVLFRLLVGASFFVVSFYAGAQSSSSPPPSVQAQSTTGTPPVSAVPVGAVPPASTSDQKSFQLKMNEFFAAIQFLMNVNQNKEGATPPSPPVARPELGTIEEFQKFYFQNIAWGEESNLDYGMQKTPGESEDDIVKQLLQDIATSPNQISTYPWIGSMFPLYQVRRFIYDREMENMFRPPVVLDATEKVFSFQGIETRKNFLKQVPAGLVLTRVDDFESYLLTGAPILDPSFSSNPMVRKAICLGMAPFEAKKCEKMLDDVLVLMKPVKSITAIPTIKEVLADPAYAEGASRAALKIMNKVQGIDPEKDQHFGDLFTDIKESYLEAGIPEEKAADMTWKLLAVYAARGANIFMLYPFAPSLEAVRTLVALQTIGSGLSVLDSMTFKKDHLYSIPKGIKTFANYGKPYHFWMAAFLARTMNLKYSSRNAAIATAALSELGYQMLSTTDGREDLFNRLVSDQPFSAEANKVRIDLGFGFAGAIYGAHAVEDDVKFFELNLDRLLNKSLKSAFISRPLTPDELRAAAKAQGLSFEKLKPYIRWVQFIKPFTIFGSAKKQVECNEILLLDPNWVRNI